MLFIPKAFAYPNQQLKECILGSKQNPLLLGVPESSIEGFCDCVLISIVDQKNDDRSSANECGSKFFK